MMKYIYLSIIFAFPSFLCLLIDVSRREDKQWGQKKAGLSAELSFVGLFSRTAWLQVSVLMLHTANMTSVVGDERELKKDRLRDKTVTAELATSRHERKMALMKRGVSTSAGVEALLAVENVHGAR